MKKAKSLFNQEANLTFPGYYDNTKLANDIRKVFVQKIECIRTALDTAASNLGPTAIEPLHTSCSSQVASFTDLLFLIKNDLFFVNNTDRILILLPLDDSKNHFTK